MQPVTRKETYDEKAMCVDGHTLRKRVWEVTIGHPDGVKQTVIKKTIRTLDDSRTMEEKLVTKAETIINYSVTSSPVEHEEVKFYIEWFTLWQKGLALKKFTKKVTFKLDDEEID